MPVQKCGIQNPMNNQEDDYNENQMLLEPNMPFEVLERNMNRMKGNTSNRNNTQQSQQPSCSNYRIPTTNEPIALSSFDDNFMNFELLLN